MIPAQFDYVRPANLDEVLRILKDREGEAKILSGGYSLIPLIKLRLAQPALLVDIQDIDGLDGIVETDDELRIGARATHRQIHENAIVADHYPMLEDATALIGDPQVRNWGTIGGSVAHADPASDWPAILIAAGALGRLPERERRARRQGARLLPRHVHDGHRADRGPDRGPHPAARPPHRRRVREARAQGRRLRHGRRGRAGHASGPTAPSRRPGSASRASRTPRSRRPTRRPSSSARPRATTSTARRARPRRRRAAPAATSAVPSTTSGRWSPS